MSDNTVDVCRLDEVCVKGLPKVDTRDLRGVEPLKIVEADLLLGQVRQLLNRLRRK